MRRTAMGGGAEFRRIEALIEAVDAPVPQDVVLGPGDDAAAVRPGGGELLVISSDLTVESVHFRREWLTWRAVGHRAVAAALSDLAAMAARPIGALVGIALPPELDEPVVLEIGRGIGECLRSQGAGLLGGDVSRSPGTVVIDVTVVGGSTEPVSRSGALPGDELWVTGELGGAAAAVAAWASDLEPHPEARRRFEAPRPRIAEAMWMIEHTNIHAMIDLSDGLGGDASHMAAASGTRLEIGVDAVPLHPVLDAWANREAALAIGAGGGEDYELLLAAAAGSVELLTARAESELDLRLTRIGCVGEGSGVVWIGADGGVVDPPAGGFDHVGEES